MSDLELMKKCLDGELIYFGELYDRYINKIFRFVYLKTTNNEVAEDIVSDVFVSALDKISSFKIDENSSVSAWFYRIAHNKVVDYYKTNRSYDDIEDYLDLGINLDYAKDIDDKDKLREIFDYIKRLKKEHRDVFLYRIFDDLSYKEISEITGIGVDNCKQIMSRTLKNIGTNFVLFVLLFLIF